MFRATIGTFVGIGAIAVAVASSPVSSQDLTRMTGSIKIDGSSTVYPITEAVAEEFAEVAPRVRVTVGVSGTGGGFKRFVVGEIDISDASRPIKPRELEAARKNGVEFIELPVAYDGLTIVVNKANYWVDKLTIDELKEIFLDSRAAKTWKDVRAEWPDMPISIYAPGTDSGTFDYFKEVITGDEGSIRSDMSVSEDDNVLVRGVSGEEGAVGFFGVAYYEENKNKLKAVPIVNPETGNAVMPTSKNIEEGDYAPFSRPLFIYVSKKSAQRPEVEAFVNFYLEDGPELASEVGYVKLPKWVQKKAIEYLRTGRTGTHFVKNGEKVSMPITKAMKD